VCANKIYFETLCRSPRRLTLNIGHFRLCLKRIQYLLMMVIVKLEGFFSKTWSLKQDLRLRLLYCGKIENLRASIFF
jgi:hypothetical protein